MALIYDLADPQELLGFVRGIQQEQETNRFALAQFLPNNDIDDIEYRVTRGQLQDEDTAVIRAWDTESPIGGRQGISRIMGELPPMSKKYRVGEEERLRRRALETGSTAQLVAAIYDDAAKGARSIAGRIERLRGEAFYKGKLEINENGVVQTVDFERDTDHDQTAAAAWSGSSVEAITEELEWLEIYRDTNGIDPALALTSNAVVVALSLNDQYRSFAAVNGITPAFLSINQINQVRAAYNLPPIARYDVKVRVDGVQERVIPEQYFIFMPPAGEPLGATFLGTTAESLELQEARQIAGDQAPGLVAVVEKTFDPVATWTKVAGIALPVLINPDLTLAADVL